MEQQRHFFSDFRLYLAEKLDRRQEERPAQGGRSGVQHAFQEPSEIGVFTAPSPETVRSSVFMQFGSHHGLALISASRVFSSSRMLWNSGAAPNSITCISS